ncbi:MAG TPA: hypothetical protein PKE29_16770 [Phycisphaerales bacterium]|nr:hypothetical protein [Phycisphaerales bacterium]
MRISLFVGTFVRSFMNRSAGGGSQVNVGGRVFHTLALLAGLCLCSNARAQCPGRWLVDLPGVEARVLALTMWDPDGSGPLSPVLVAGGDFVSTNDINYIAFWDGTTWNPISTGMDGPVMGLFVDSNGDLIAGGHFTTAGGVSANNIAKWNGTTWSALGSGITSPPGSLFCVASPYLPDGVRAIAQFPNGDLVVGGFFDTAGGGTANNIAVWNGTAWSTLASGTNNAVNALAFLQNGDLIVGGQFSSASGVSNTVSIARWTSSTSTPTWQSMGNADKCVLALVVGPTGDLFAAGDFYTIGGVASENLAKFDGTGWSVVGSVPIPPDGHGTSALLILANGDLIAAGNFVTVDGISANNIARWDGSRLTPPSSPSWHTVGSGLSGGDWYYPVFALAQTPAGDLVAGGSFQQAGVHAANGIALWDGTEPSPPTTPDWHRLRFPFNERFNGPVFAFLHLDDGSLIVGGDFTLVGETPINRIARWNGATWSAFGSGMNDAVRALALLPNPSTQEKRLVAGGDFTTAGGSTRNRVALWDGTAWQSMNAGMNSTVRALAYSPMDGLLAGGDFTSAGTHGCLHVAAWTGSNWENPG